MPLLIALNRGTAAQAKTIRRAIEQGGLDELNDVLDTVSATGALTYVRQLAEKEANIACEAINHLAYSAHKNALTQLAEFAVKRDF